MHITIANNVDPDQTAPSGAVWSGSALFILLILKRGCFGNREPNKLESRLFLSFQENICKKQNPSLSFVRCFVTEI